MEREHLIIVAILALVLYMLMKHSSDCDCTKCMKDKMISPLGHIRYQDDMPITAHIRMRSENPLDGPLPEPSSHIRTSYSDKYIGAGQHIKSHIRYDSRQGMFNGMFSGSPQHIRYDVCASADPPPGC
jgi:hypothetical protein